jgi:RNA polymerase sigma-70 factor (ECF subfamily)
VSSAGQPDPGIHADSDAVAERCRASIHRYVSRLVRDATIADDLTQETFLRVHQHLEKLKDAAAVEAWLYRIATNVCYDHFRRRENREPALTLPSPDEDRDDAEAEEDALRPDQLLEQREMSDCVLRFLVELPLDSPPGAASPRPPGL